MNFGKNSLIGIGLIAVALVLAVIINSVGARIMEANEADCGCTAAGEVCSMADGTLPIEVYIGYTLSVLLIAIGVFLIFTDLRKVKLGKEAAANWKKVTSALEGEEKIIYELIASAEGVMFQSNIVEKSGLQKVKVSRVLDRMEARGLVERRRRGMSNVVVLKSP